VKIKYSTLEDIATKLLLAIGENPERPGLVDTPRRFAKWWIEFMEYDPGNTDTCFESVTTDSFAILV
jgi:GTP cyclohydrolase I